MSSTTAIVDGDVLIDCNLFVRPGGVHRQHCAGGACLVKNLVCEFARDLKPNWTVSGPQADETRPEQHHQSHAIMSFGADQIWRVERFLGVQKGPDAPRVKAGATGLLVLFDANLGFASKTPTICCAGKPWIVLKTSEPDLDTPLGRHLVDQHARKLVVVTGIEDLRRMEVQVSRRLSWERTAQETVRAIHDGERLARLEKCSHVIVSFGTSGAAVLSGRKAQLLFDPSRMEKEWESKGPTRMIGYASTLVAAVAHQVMKNPKKPSFTDAVQRGVAGMRSLYNIGYGTAATASDKLVFPAETVVKEALSAKASLSVTAINTTRLWTALSDHVAREYKGNVYSLAVAVAVLGPEEMLSEVPHLKVGKLFTADRGEIESFAVVKELLAEYVQRTSNAKPFSIVVFGPPGSGKSFGVKQVASAIGADVETRTFNLTQFSSPSDLHGAFHQIRDISLSGKLPLVFWDEFDTKQGGEDLGWPRHFLAPMQDGEFQAGQLTHPIGKSIFVFAGGTADSWSDFQKRYPFDGAQWKPVKLKDFASRLKGHLDVIGPNSGGHDDPFCMVRRAILLRSILQRDCPWLFVGKELRIEAEVLCAFLRTPKYEHGARSMEAIVSMSGLSGKKIYDTSSLPPDSQLAMHVQTPFECPGDEPALAGKFEDDVAVIERLAPMAHSVFAQTRSRFGWTYGTVRDDKARVHNLLVPYSDLPRAAKEANRESVRNIPRKLGEIGYIVRRARPGEVPRALTDEEVDKLAPLEHVIWMESKEKEGFTHGLPTPDDPCRSPYLIDWGQLSDEFKETDRDMVRAIPSMLAQAGYTFEREHED